MKKNCPEFLRSVHRERRRIVAWRTWTKNTHNFRMHTSTWTVCMSVFCSNFLFLLSRQKGTESCRSLAQLIDWRSRNVRIPTYFTHYTPEWHSVSDLKSSQDTHICASCSVRMCLECAFVDVIAIWPRNGSSKCMNRLCGHCRSEKSCSFFLPKQTNGNKKAKSSDLFPFAINALSFQFIAEKSNIKSTKVI